MPSDMPHFKLRLPADLLDRIKAAAEESGRTQTNEMVRRLEASFLNGENFPPDLQRELQRFAAKTNPATTARALAVDLVRDGLSQMRWDEEQAVLHDRENKLDLGSLTDDQYQHLLKLFEAARETGKSKATPKKSPAKK